MRLPGVDKCITYDARFQASNLEEAMIAFVDLSMDPRIHDQRIGVIVSSIWPLRLHIMSDGTYRVIIESDYCETMKIISNGR